MEPLHILLPLQHGKSNLLNISKSTISSNNGSISLYFYIYQYHLISAKFLLSKNLRRYFMNSTRLVQKRLFYFFQDIVFYFFNQFYRRVNLFLCFFSRRYIEIIIIAGMTYFFSLSNLSSQSSWEDFCLNIIFIKIRKGIFVPLICVSI